MYKNRLQNTTHEDNYDFSSAILLANASCDEGRASVRYDRTATKRRTRLGRVDDTESTRGGLCTIVRGLASDWQEEDERERTVWPVMVPFATSNACPIAVEVLIHCVKEKKKQP